MAKPTASPVTAAARPSVFTPGDVLAGRYRIVHFLAQGGMGEVYEAEDTELREKVALKTISATSADPSAIDRFKREISLARKVTHPNVCRIFDLGQHTVPGTTAPPVTFLTMELLQGETLSRCLRRRGRLGTAEALPTARQVASALDAAHQASIIHRDLKSENIFLVREAGMIRAVVTDFGIARGGRDDQFAAMVTGTDIVGTPAYMAPEQVEGKPVTTAADVYAFGVVLYEMVTGRLPFESDNPITTAAKRLQEPPRPPREHVPDLDATWEQVILRCLERHSDRRFLSAGEAVEALENATWGTQAGQVTAAGVPSRMHQGPTAQLPAAQVPPTQGVPTQVPPAPGVPTQVPPAQVPLQVSSTPTGQPVVVPVATPSPGAYTGMVTTATLNRAAAEPKSSKSLRSLLTLLGVVVAVSAGLFAFNILRGEDPRREPRRSIAVVGFQNLSGQEDKDWLATALAEMLGTELAHGEKLRAVSGDQVARVKQELGLDNAVEISEERMRQIHANLGCDFLVSGSFVATPDQLRIDVRLADAAVGKPLASFAQHGSEAQLFDLVKGLGSDVRGRLGVGQVGGENRLAGLPSDRQAARLYTGALDSLRRYDPLAARDALTEASRIEPENPLIRSALSSAWQALGYGERAAAEAKQAFELSSDLPQEDRLVIEGRFRESQGDWPSAVGVYTQLWDFFPDDLEHGLRLVAAQTASRLPGDALAAVDRLRELPAPVSEDVRIDLAEAEAAAMAADFTRQLDAASRGVGKAQTIGAKLLEAQARVTESQAFRMLGQAEDSAQSARHAHGLYDGLEQPQGAALALLALANAHFDLADFDDAMKRCEEAIELYRTIGDEGSLASAMNNLALMLKRKGELERAQALYEEVEQTFETTGNRLGLASAVNNQAAILILRDELALSRETFERAKAIFQEVGEPNGEATSLNNIAHVLRLEGQLAASREANEQALEMRRSTGLKGGEVYSLINLGAVLADLGELAEADRLLGEGRQLAEQMGHRSALASALFELGRLRLVEGRLDEAKARHEEAMAIRQELDEKTAIAESHAVLARLRLERGEPAVAEVDALHAVDAFSKDGRRAEQGQAHAFLALALAEQGLTKEGRRSLGDARELGGESQQFAIRFRIRLAEARLAAAGRQTGTALRALLALDKGAEETGFAALAYEARLTRLLIEGRRSTEALRALGEEAAARGFGWIAAKAEAALN